MNKLSKIIMAIIILALSSTLSIAQDYKHPYGLVDKKKSNVTKSTEFSTLSTSNNINYVGANGNLVSPKTGKVIGRLPKNAVFVNYFDNTSFIKRPSQLSENHKCLQKSKYFPVLHENYKHAGACNYRCRLQ